jgi:hypothetical protein
MSLRGPFNGEPAVSQHSLLVADFLAKQGGEGASFSEIEAATGIGHARDKVRSLNRNGWTIAEDFDAGRDEHVCELIADPRDRAAA